MAKRRDSLADARTHRFDADLLGLLIDTLQDYAIFIVDPQGRIVSWNRGAERINGYRADEVVGRHFSIFYLPEDIEANQCKHALEVATSAGRFEAEGWRVRKDGTKFWASVVVTALRDDTGKLRGFGKVTRDLTIPLQAERERIQRARAEEGERRTEEFVAVMGHELRNPLASMLTAVHLIKLRRGVHVDREIGVLDRQLVHMMRLLDDLRDVSLVLRDKIRLSTKVVEIAQVLAGAVDVAAPLIQQKEHRLRMDIPEAPLLVEVDPDRITQVFVNLLTNAAKYTHNGGEIRVRAEAVDHAVTVTVEDTGIGIDPDALPRIFDLFAQATQTAERPLGGFGIGLAVAKQLVTQHGGEITAQSQGRGRGSRFAVRLPRGAGTLEEHEVVMQALPRAQTPRRVLVVDDNHDANEMMQVLLTQLGHEVRTASDGPRALRIARDFSPHIIFLDIGLPGMTGFELARRLRKLASCRAIPIIAVSGYARASDRKEAMKAGFTEHFAKPIDLTRLQELIERAQPRS